MDTKQAQEIGWHFISSCTAFSCPKHGSHVIGFAKDSAFSDIVTVCCESRCINPPASSKSKFVMVPPGLWKDFKDLLISSGHSSLQRMGLVEAVPQGLTWGAAIQAPPTPNPEVL